MGEHGLGKSEEVDSISTWSSILTRGSMCIYSNVGDWGRRWDKDTWIPNPYRIIPGLPIVPMPRPDDSKDLADQLEKIKNRRDALPKTPWAIFKEMLKLAQQLDVLLGQPDCEDEAKVAWMKEVEELIASKCLHPETKRVEIDDQVKFVCAECPKEFS